MPTGGWDSCKPLESGLGIVEVDATVVSSFVTSEGALLQSRLAGRGNCTTPLFAREAPPPSPPATQASLQACRQGLETEVGTLGHHDLARLA